MGLADGATDMFGRGVDVEVWVRDDEWERGLLFALNERDTAALIEWRGTTAWHFRDRPNRRPDEWRLI